MTKGGENVKEIDSEGDKAQRMMYFEAACSCRETDRLGEKGVRLTEADGSERCSVHDGWCAGSAGQPDVLV